MKAQRRDKEVDTDLYSTHLLDELLETTKEWENVQEIVPLTFKAVVDMLATHSQALKDIKAVLTTRASKTELTTGLSLKSNVSDVSKAVQQLSQALQERPTFTEISSTLQQYATKLDLTDLMSMSQTNRNLTREMGEKESTELAILRARMDEFQKEITKKVTNCATLQELSELTSIVEAKANISEINEALEQKVSKQYLTTAMQKKANKTDLEALLAKKAETTDLEYIVNSLESKVSVSTLDKLTQVLENKVDKSEFAMQNNERNSHNRSQLRQQEQEWLQKLEHVKSSFSLELKELRKEMSLEIKQSQGLLQLFKKQFQVQLRKCMAQIESELVKKQSKFKQQVGQEIDSFRQALRLLQDESGSRGKSILSLNVELTQLKRGEENIYSQIDEVRKKLEEGLCKGVEKKEFIDFKSELIGMIENKVELEEVQAALNKFEATINVRLATDRTEQMQELKAVKDIISQNSQASMMEIQELRRSMIKKPERGDSMSGEEGLRKIRKEIEDCRKTVDLIYCEVQAKISVKEYQTDLVEIRKRFEALTKEVGFKANIKDVCVLSDSKPNIDDVNNALREINEALADKVTEVDLQAVLKDQATINQTLCSENIVGRWMWHSGEIRTGSLIPWESQSANTVPDHFFWEKDKTSILIIAAGVYEITACVFARGAVIGIMANGQMASQHRSEQNQNSMNTKIKRKKEKGVGSTSITQYLLLPARSRLSVSSSGQGCEGFLNIRRL